MERTLILVKPDGVQRGLIGEVIARFEKRGLKLVGLKFIQMDRDLAERHYGVHKLKPFYNSLVEYITSGPVVAMVWEGKRAIDAARMTIGKTNPAEADSGTIRGDLGMEIGRNIVHGSDGPDNAAKEIELFFDSSQLISWDRGADTWIQE